MIQWNFKIDGELVDEPVGWSDIVLQIVRDPDWSGIFFEASTSTLGFYGRGAEILMAKKAAQMLGATALLEIEAVCGQELDILTGSLDFGVYDEQCGATCIVNIGVEKIGCTMTLRNRFDQKVEMSDPVAFNKITVLPNYPGLNFSMDIEAQELDTRVEGYVSDDGDQGTYQAIPHDFGVREFNIRPIYENEKFNSINRGELIPSVNVTEEIDSGYPVSPYLLLDENLSCFGDGVFNYTFRLKGRYSVDTNMGDARSVLRLFTWSGVGDFVGGDIVEEFEIFNNDSYIANDVIEFDHTFTGTIFLTNGQSFYVDLQVGSGSQDSDEPTISWEFDPETYGLVFINKMCPSTEATVSLINEAGSRIMESVTDGCLRMKSDYYGRTDSQPYSSAEDGCGSLRIITSGLRLRNAENPVHFISPKEFFNGLRGIDNIGIGVEQDEIFPTREWVRVEPVEYFYDSAKEILRLDAVPGARFKLDPSKGYSLVKIGYQKWEVEQVNGLDEFNSNKEFRTSLTTLNNPLDAQSNFVAGGYPIEITRQQSFAASGGADTTYDNETFIICVERDAYGFHVEQGNILDAANFYSPATAYNWRIRPFYNLMRWWKSIAQSYANLAITASKLFFSSGTGNLLATGRLPLYDPCDLAAGAYPENDDLDINHFIIENLPIFQPERVTFTYPMSLRDYLQVKAYPYGYISVQCGSGDFIKAFILDIQYRPAVGLADFNLQLAWDTA